MVSGLGGHCRGGSKSIISRSLVVVALIPVHRYLVRCDLVSDDEVVSSVEGSFNVVYFGADCHCSIDDFKVGFVFVKSLP